MMAPTVNDTTTAMSVTAITVAEPRSSVGFTRSHRLRCELDPEPQRSRHTDPRHHEVTVVPHLDPGACGSDPTRHLHRHALVAPSREPGRLPRRVDAAHLQRHRLHPRKTRHQHGDECRDRDGGLHRGATRVPPQRLVVSALAMMFVSALTIESPVTTV